MTAHFSIHFFKSELRTKIVFFPYQLELLHEVVNRRWCGTEDAVLAVDEAQKEGQLEIAEALDLFEEVVIVGHWGSRSATSIGRTRTAKRVAGARLSNVSVAET